MLKRGLGFFAAVALLLCASACGKKNADDNGDGDAAYQYSCQYVNPYSQGNECIEYLGAWTEAEARPHCENLYSAASFVGEFGTDRCGLGEDCVASCAQESDEGNAFVTRFYGAQTDMAMTQQFCEGEQFGSGTFSAGCEEAGGEVDAGETPLYTLEQEALDAMVSDDGVTVDPECTDDACIAEMAEAKQWITFTPVGGAPKAAFILYPGAGIDVRAYAPAAHAIAAEGVLAVLVPMEGNFAPNGYDRATAIQEAHAEVESWFLGGHSLGGIAALQYAQENEGAMKGLILWATYGSEEYDISKSATPVTVLYGTADGVSTPEEIDQGKPYLPEDAVYIALPGANHAQFGYYGKQEGDGTPQITKANQQALVVGATVHSVHRVIAGGASENPAFADAKTTAEGWCQRAQQITANVGADTPALSKTSVQHTDNVDDFTKSSASIDTGAGTVSTADLMHYAGNADLLQMAPVYEDEVWCKMKTQTSLVAGLGLTAAGDPKSCAAVNEAVLAWALAAVTAGEKSAYEGSGKSIVFGADIAAESGPEWIDTLSTFAETATEGVFELKAASLLVGEATEYPVEKRQVFYCKLWTPARALRWVLALE